MPQTQLTPEIRETITFDDDGLIPAIAQEATTGEVLMLAWMNEEALAWTLSSGRATYWSRSRGQLWRKGDTSGHVQQVIDVALDCDGDTLLVTVQQTGPACHTGTRSCFSGRRLPTVDGVGTERTQGDSAQEGS